MEGPKIKSIIQNTYDAKIEITANDGSVIYYTTDNSEPTRESALYDGPFDYPIPNTAIKAIAVLNEEQSEVTSFTCMTPCPPGRLNEIKKNVGTLLITEPLDFCNASEQELPECIIIGNGSINNIQTRIRMTGIMYPLGLDFNKFFRDAGDLSNYVCMPGQIFTKDGRLIRFDGEDWHAFQEIHSGSFAKRPQQNVPVGFAYFCTDRQTAEGAKNGIVIYYAGNGTWVDALGRIVE